MNIGYNLNLTQEQKLIMTVEMQQSIKILQMTSVELIEHINREIQDNVVLEYEESYDCNEDAVKKQSEAAEYNKLINYLESDGYEGGGRYSSDKEYVSPFDFISSVKTLKDYLIDQIIYMDISRRSEIICKYIIEDIDSRGYLDENILDFIEDELNIDAHEAKECLRIVQSLEPAGVGARNLKECLGLQLKAQGIHDRILESIIESSLVDISEGKMKKIAKEYSITIEQAEKYRDIIRKLEPKPSRGFFTGEEIGYIIPDVYIRKTESGYVAFLNEAIFPKLTVNDEYRKVLNGDDLEAANYIKGKIENANSLIKSIDKRKNTILKVMEEIINIQGDKIEIEDDGLRPMTIGDVSKRINLHESTVSRAVKDKYASLPSGHVVKIRSLFTNHISDANSDISSVSIKHDIKQMIENEDKHKPLSDEDISVILKSRGIDISRRTVAKYRTEQNILNSSKRKRL